MVNGFKFQLSQTLLGRDRRQSDLDSRRLLPCGAERLITEVIRINIQIYIFFMVKYCTVYSNLVLITRREFPNFPHNRHTFTVYLCLQGWCSYLLRVRNISSNQRKKGTSWRLRSLRRLFPYPVK